MIRQTRGCPPLSASKIIILQRVSDRINAARRLRSREEAESKKTSLRPRPLSRCYRYGHCRRKFQMAAPTDEFLNAPASLPQYEFSVSNHCLGKPNRGKSETPRQARWRNSPCRALPASEYCNDCSLAVIATAICSKSLTTLPDFFSFPRRYELWSRTQISLICPGSGN